MRPDPIASRKWAWTFTPQLNLNNIWIVFQSLRSGLSLPDVSFPVGFYSHILSSARRVSVCVSVSCCVSNLHTVTARFGGIVPPWPPHTRIPSDRGNTGGECDLAGAAGLVCVTWRSQWAMAHKNQHQVRHHVSFGIRV